MSTDPVIRKIEIERFTLTSSKAFDDVVAAINAEIGHPDMAEFLRSTSQAKTASELEATVQKSIAKTGLMLFLQLDHGGILRMAAGRSTAKMARLIMGNPLIMKEMAKHVPDAGSYAPVTVLVDERGDGVYVSYDRMASLLAPYGNPDALAVARSLDNKVEALLQRAAG
jgi:uncharacterized protein (DUF302 family)